MGTVARMARIAGLAWILGLLAVSQAFAAEPETPAPQYSQAELDSMLAPIALYPDPLLAQILMAATYPLEVVQAARWSREHPEVNGDQAVRAVDDRDWDPSVKSLVAFPDVLAMMDERLDWTQQMGEAFLGDTTAAMDTVQRLRRAAFDQGNLRSTDEVAVSREGEEILIEPPAPDTVYVPYYDPNVVYGDWWWPESPPVYWDPWPGYLYSGYGWGWGIGVPVGVGFFYSNVDWHHHHVGVGHHRPFYYHHRDHDTHNPLAGDWRHDPRHRRGVGYRNPQLDQRYAAGNGGSATHWRDGQRQRPGQPGSATGGAAQRPTPGTSQGFFPSRPQTPSASAGLLAPGEVRRGYAPTPTYRAAPSRPQASPGQPLARPAQPQAGQALPSAPRQYSGQGAGQPRYGTPQRVAPSSQPQQLAPMPQRQYAPAAPMPQRAPAPAPSAPPSSAGQAERR